VSRRKTEDADLPLEPGLLVGALLRNAYRRVYDVLQARLAARGFDGLDIAQAGWLQRLRTAPEGMRATELAVHAGITKQSMGALLESYLALGYVERIDDPSDKRAKLVRFTVRGYAAVKLIRDTVRELERDWGERVGHDKIDALKATLNELLVSFEEDPPVIG